jgi:hypothetical protein
MNSVDSARNVFGRKWRRESACLFLTQEQIYLRCARNATSFSHLLAHFPQYLANELRNLTKKSDGKWKKSSSGCHVTLCEKTDSLKALGSVAGYLEKGNFHSINDIEVGLIPIHKSKNASCRELNASNLHVRILIKEHDWSFAPELQGSCFYQNTYREAWSCPSQHSVGKGNLADHEANQEAQREGDEHRDDEFEQRIQRNRMEGIGKTHHHQGVDQVDRVSRGG